MSAIDQMMKRPPQRSDKVSACLASLGEDYTEKFNKAVTLGYPPADLARTLRQDSGWQLDTNAVAYYRRKNFPEVVNGG